MLWAWPQNMLHPQSSRQQACQVCVHASDTTHVRTMVEALQLSGQVISFQVPSLIKYSSRHYLQHHPTVPPHTVYLCQSPSSSTAHVRTMVEALQLSGQVISFQVPSEIMGSTVKVCPGFITPMVLFSAGSSGAGGGLPCEVRMY